MTKKLRLLISGSLTVLLIIGLVFTYSNKETKSKTSIETQRESYSDFLKNNPYQETLTWDKRKEKLNGLPPNRYFEQMWGLTIDPSTGKLNDGKLSELRMQIIQDRAAKKNPGDAGNAWEERGPNNVGGRTKVIMFDPNDLSNNTVYAGGVSGGLWKSTNISSSGSTWSRVENVPGNLSVTSITVDPRNSNIWYVGTGEQYTAGDVVGNGVYMTTNGGISWSAINIPPADGGDINYSAANLFLSGIYYVNDVLAWDNGSSTELFVAVGAHVYGDSSDPTNWLGLQTAGLYHSTDGGSNWNRIETSNMQHTFGGLTYYYIPNDLEVGADNRLWMGTIGSALGEGGGRVYSSTNGNSWTEAAASPLTDSNRVELEPSATNGNKLYALTQGVSSPVHIYETTNAFGSITSTSLPNDADTGIASNDFCRGQAFYDLVIEADPSNDNILYVGGIDLFKTTNSGSSWSQLSHWYGGFGYQEVHADQHSIAFGNNSSSELLFGNDGGIFYSGNSGSTISVRNTGYNVTQFVKAGIGPDGVGDTNGIFTAGAQDNGTQAFRDGNTTAGVNPSEELSDGDGFYTFVDKDGQYMIATYVYNVIYRFNLPWNGQGRIDGGATTLSSDQTTGDFVNQMAYDSDANRLLSNKSTSTSNAILSVNVASNSNGTLTNTALTGKPTAFRASPFASNTWYVGMDNGGLVRLTNVGNTSATWSTITTPFVGAVSSVRLGETANDLIVTMHNYGVTSIWHSSDAGSSWTSKEGNLPDIPVRDFLLNPLNTSEAIIATQLGVWGTSDFNAANPTWTQSYDGMSDVSVTSLDYWDVSGDDITNKIIASTYGRGVFTGTFTATSVPDTEAPTTPTNLVASNITESTVNLSWTVSSDNIGVSGYDVYQGATKIATVTNNAFQVTGLTPSTSYNFSIIAKDATGNESTTSNTVNVTTLAPDNEAPTTPTNLSASNITDSSVSLSWNISTDNVAVSGYDVYQGATKIGTVTGTTFQVSGLSADTSYNYTVIALDAAGNESLASNQVTITTGAVPVTYCASNGSTQYQTGISRVIFGTIDNADGPAKDVGYEDFTNLNTAVTRSSSENLTVYVNTDGNYRVDALVWIDWNQNGVFTDTGETYDLGNISNVANGALPTLSISIPESAKIGNSRMRVSARYNSNPTSCQTSFDGEVEDYTVIVEGSGPDETPPTITLNGNSTINLNVGDNYIEQGAAATDNIDGVITANIVIGGDAVNTASAGTYVVTYNVSDAAGNAATQVSRTVNITVVPDTTAPVITLNGNSTINLNVGDNYIEQGAAATDNIDGVITANIVIGGDVVNTASAGTYVVTYNVSDAAGNAAVQVSRTVSITVVPDTTAPVITLNGNSTINLNVGDNYIEQGAAATDNIDGVITANIVIGGDTVNTASAGTYVVTYNVSDAAGNAAVQVSRTVSITVVPDTTAPVITLNGNSTINLNVGDNYIEQGAAATDNIDGVITANIVIGGDAVNTASAGTYVVTYNVSDAAGNAAVQVSRTVNITVVPDTEAPSSPTNLSVSNITETSADLSWNVSTDNVGVTGYDVYQGATKIATITGSTYQVSGLNPNTSYSFSVIAFDAETNESGASNSVNVTTLETQINYCTSTSTSTSSEYISRVQLNSLNNSSGPQTYSDFTSMSTTLTKGTQYTVTITPTWNGKSRREAYGVWIDYNKDGDFTDSGEQVYSRSPTKGNPVSGSFTVPNGAAESATRMRVSMKYNGNPSSCETFSSGEVEDYTVVIQGTGPDLTAPVITLNGSSTINLNVGATYNEQGATASDNIDGNIDANIVIGGDTVDTGVEGAYIVTYNVSDAAGNAATQVSRTVNVIVVQDNTPPVIALEGNSTINLNVGATYTEQGATATDDIDGNISANIVIGGDSVITATEGTYVVTYNVSDAAGNAATQLIRTVIVSTSSSTVLLGSYFESSFDGWADGGNDCARVATSNSYEGSSSIRLRDNSGVSSSMTSPTLDLSSYGQVEVSFYFYANSMETGEDLWLRYNDGSGFTTIDTRVSGTDFNNGNFNNVVVTLDAGSYNLSSSAQFRIQCDASGNNDQVYIDQVVITGLSNSGTIPESSITELSVNTPNTSGVNYGAFDINNFEFEEDFSVYPNPVSSHLTIRLGLDIEKDDVDVSMNIYDVRGRVVKSKIWNKVTNEFFEKRIDISNLSHGVYMINVVSSNGMNESEKLIVK